MDSYRAGLRSFERCLGVWQAHMAHGGQLRADNPTGSPANQQAADGAGRLLQGQGRRREALTMKLDRILDIVINKFHILLGTAAQAAVFFWQYKGHDIGPGVQNSLYAYFAFLL